MVETLSNLANSTLVSAITNVSASLVVGDGTKFPATGNFRIRIDDELILVGARSGTTLSSLTRGIESTTAAAHSAAVLVRHVLTAASVRQVITDHTWINAQTYLKGDGTTEDAAAITAFSAAASGKVAYFPAGTYTLPASTTITTTENTIYRGAGQSSTSITSSGAYCFTAPAAGSQDRVIIEDMICSLRAGATTGGAIKVVSNSYHSQWEIRRIQAVGVSTCTNPVIHVDGFIGSWIDECNVGSGAGHQISAESTGFVTNAMAIYRTRIFSTLNSSTYAGIYVSGGSHHRIRDCTIEQLRGYGIYLSGSNWSIIDGNWFEDNSNHNLYVVNAFGTSVIDNKFHYNNGGIPTADHVNITRSAAGSRDHHQIAHNHFQDASTSGISIRIGTNVEDTVLAFNRNLTSDVITDSGTGTALLQPATNGTDTSWRIPKGVTIVETAVPPTPAANRVTLSVADNGAGSSLLAKFEDGAVRTVARKEMNIITDNGSPEAVFTAPIGSLYLRQNGGANTTLYVKESGTGNTGWIAK